MPRAPKTCSLCNRQAVKGSRCAEHPRDIRPNAAARGYDHKHRTRFRAAVLARDPICVWPGCHQPSTDADHHPLSRRELIARGLDPNDPAHGRGLCHQHHSAHGINTGRWGGGDPLPREAP